MSYFGFGDRLWIAFVVVVAYYSLSVVFVPCKIASFISVRFSLSFVIGLCVSNKEIVSCKSNSIEKNIYRRHIFTWCFNTSISSYFWIEFFTLRWVFFLIIYYFVVACNERELQGLLLTRKVWYLYFASYFGSLWNILQILNIHIFGKSASLSWMEFAKSVSYSWIVKDNIYLTLACIIPIMLRLSPILISRSDYFLKWVPLLSWKFSNFPIANVWTL